MFVRRFILASAATAAAVAMSFATLLAQPQRDSSAAFEVASVKPNTSRAFRALRVDPGGRFTATNVPLRELIRFAYDIQNDQLTGGPDWMRTERFDVAGIPGGDWPPRRAPGPPAATRMMLRSLLVERFALAIHREARDLPIYSLEMVRSDRQPGPALRRSPLDCVTELARESGWALPRPPATSGEAPVCDLVAGFGRFTAGGADMTQLAEGLSQHVNRVVVDRTRLEGRFDFEFDWTPEQLPRPEIPNQIVRVNGVDIDPNGPSLFTALREQLGLKLESSRGAVDVIVIDRVERPTPD